MNFHNDTQSPILRALEVVAKHVSLSSEVQKLRFFLSEINVVRHPLTCSGQFVNASRIHKYELIPTYFLSENLVRK
jgi:hypothetical protein